MIKLIATDLDGTLLPTGTEISPENIEAAKKAAAAGVTVTIATGRMYRAALPVAKNLGVDVPIITYNGALIRTVSGKTLFSSGAYPGGAGLRGGAGLVYADLLQGLPVLS